MKTEHAIIGFVATAIVCFVLGYVLGTNRAPADDAQPAVAVAVEDDKPTVAGKDSDLIPVGDSASKGPENAPVTIIEFSEFQCPFCSRVNPTIAQIQKDYPEDVRIVFKHNPLSFHKDAPLASEASLAANEQGKFWEYHDVLFQNQKALKRDQLEKYAEQVGLDMAKFKSALDQGKFKKAVAADQALAGKLGARGTPNFFVNGKKLVGAKPVSAFKEVIDAELKKARGSTYAARVKANYKKDAKGKGGKKKGSNRPPRNDKTIYKVDLAGAPFKGSADAIVTIIEFSDFECPFCTRVNPTIKSILEDPKYKGKVRFAFKQLPLPFHRNAKGAAEAALAANEQGKFWEMHDILFANQKKLTRPDLDGYAQQIGLNIGKFKKAMDSNKFAKQVAADQAQARKFGARGTPHFFVNGKRLSGAQPLPKFQAAVDDALKRAEPHVGKGLKGEALYAAIIAKGATEFKASPSAGGNKRAEDNKIYDVKVPEGTPWKGGKNAKVEIVEFSDFQCAFCGRVNPSLAGIQKKYGDKVKIYFMHQPLPFHKDAPLAAEASLAANEQGKFWEYHDVLFENQKALKRPDLEKYAEQLGLNMTKFKAALDQGTYTAKVKADSVMGSKLGARGTPTFFINGRKLVGAQPQAAFEVKVEEALKGKK